MDTNQVAADIAQDHVAYIRTVEDANDYAREAVEEGEIRWEDVPEVTAEIIRILNLSV